MKNGSGLEDIQARPHLAADKEGGFLDSQRVIRPMAAPFLGSEDAGNEPQCAGNFRGQGSRWKINFE
ncbi:MAG: hypothetical protein PF568_03765, partial [Deltaproteobacteria bacterium]|nr:hypothetical protein [Deltaproteobacteria bacterium]